MKNLLLKFKGWFGSMWGYVLDHYLCVCSVLILTICFFGYTLKLTADYEKELNEIINSHNEAIGLIKDQGETINKQDEVLGRQRDLINEQAVLINNLVRVINEHKATIIYQQQVIQELMKRLRDLGGLPSEPPTDKSKWIICNESSYI